MHKTEASRSGKLTTSVRRTSSLLIDGVRAEIWSDPSLLPVSSDWAKVWRPNTSLARAV